MSWTQCARETLRAGVRKVCGLEDGHPGEHDWNRCGAGATGDPFCDVECQRERGHDGPHRHEWED